MENLTLETNDRMVCGLEGAIAGLLPAGSTRGNKNPGQMPALVKKLDPVGPKRNL